jgi:integrase
VVYSYLASMFGAAVLDRAIGGSPCVGIQLPEVEKAALFVATVDQVAGLAGALPRRYAAQPYVAGGTGLRQGEVWGLELDRVDFLRRQVRVEQQLKVVSGRRPFLAPPKTATSRRTVELPRTVAEPLARHLEEFPAVEVEIEDETNPRRPVVRMAKLVFTNGSGKPISRFGWSHLWAPAAAAGLPKGTGFHALRHLFATLLIYGGANVKTVQLALGHATPTITLNTYVGLWPDAVDTTRGLVDAAFGGRAGRRLVAVG